jgi:hypothetical protein
MAEIQLAVVPEHLVNNTALYHRGHFQVWTETAMEVVADQNFGKDFGVQVGFKFGLAGQLRQTERQVFTDLHPRGQNMPIPLTRFDPF